jgi:transcription antitermination factor NusG
MPILPPEPHLFPDDLFAGAPPAVDAPEHWWVLHTRPRAEKTLSRHCLGRQLSFFLPLCERHTHSRGRTLTSHVPLFPGYLFLRADDAGRVEALTTNLVVNCLPVPDQAELHADLARVERLMASEIPVAPEERLLPGTPVEIVRGPLAGLRGKVVRQGKHLRFVIEVHFLHKGAWVEIEGWMLEKVS